MSFSQDVFSYMSDWYHLAILELTFVKGFKSEAKWMSRRLGISEAEVKPAVDRLFASWFTEVREKSPDEIETSTRHDQQK